VPYIPVQETAYGRNHFYALKGDTPSDLQYVLNKVKANIRFGNTGTF